MSWTEAAAAAITLISVYLSARQNIWSWPTAIVNVGLYTFVFFATGLYSDMGLQVVYLVLSVYGWYEWLHGGAHRSRLHVSRATPRAWIVSGSIAIVFWIVWGRYMSTLRGVSLPYIDAGLATLSLVAQWMMTRKILENWIVWVAVDVVYIGMFLYKSLVLTAGLYAVFLVLSLMGYFQWRRTLQPAPS